MINVLFDPDLKKWGKNITCKKRVPGWKIIFKGIALWISRDPCDASGKEAKHRWRHSTHRHETRSSILWMYWMDSCDVFLWRSCRFLSCILEKNAAECWPNCFFSLSVQLQSELGCEVWEDDLNKWYMRDRTASLNQDVDSLWKWCVIGCQWANGQWMRKHLLENDPGFCVWFCFKPTSWRWMGVSYSEDGAEIFRSLQGKVVAQLLCFLEPAKDPFFQKQLWVLISFWHQSHGWLGVKCLMAFPPNTTDSSRSTWNDFPNKAILETAHIHVPKSYSS